VNVNAGVRWERIDARRSDLGFITGIPLPRASATYDMGRERHTTLMAAYSGYGEELSDQEIAGLMTRYGIGVQSSGLNVFGPATSIHPNLRVRWSDEAILRIAHSGLRYYANASAGWKRLRNDWCARHAMTACASAIPPCSRDANRKPCTWMSGGGRTGTSSM
jgi:hypothetical protein